MSQGLSKHVSKTRECVVCLNPMVLGKRACQHCGSEQWRWVKKL